MTFAGCSATPAHLADGKASASAATGAPAPELHVNVTRDSVSLEGAAKPLFSVTGNGRDGADGALKLNGPDDYFITSFGEALTQARAKGLTGDRLHVVIDPDVSYRLLLELLFTAGQMKVTVFDLEEKGVPGRLFRVESSVEVPVASGAAVDGRLGLALSFTADGVGMATVKGNILPECAQRPVAFGPRLTFPNVDGAIDLLALRTCATRAKATRAELEGTSVVTLLASAKDPPTFDAIARVAVTIHGDDAHPLFPDIRLAMVP